MMMIYSTSTRNCYTTPIQV